MACILLKNTLDVQKSDLRVAHGQREIQMHHMRIKALWINRDGKAVYRTHRALPRSEWGTH